MSTAGYRTFTTVAGFTLQYRTLPPDFLPALRARVRRDHEPSRPAPVTVQVETAPGTFAEQAVDPTGELPADEALAARVVAYRDELRAWEGAITDAITREIQAVLLRTLKFPIDASLVAETRELYALAGEDLSGETDEAVMLWKVILPDQGDQMAVTMSLQGISVEEAAARAREMFRLSMGRASA